MVSAYANDPLPSHRRAVRRRSIRRWRSRAKISGAVVLEVILTLPLLAIVLMAIVEFGIMLTNLQYVEFASRTAAQVAARLDQTSFYSGPIAVMPPEIVAAVNSQLAQTNGGGPALTASKVYLEHTVPASGSGVGVVRHVCGGTTPTPCTGSDVEAPTVTGSYRYVRVTVFVEASQAAPNLLATFGFDLAGSHFQQTTTLPYLR